VGFSIGTTADTQVPAPPKPWSSYANSPCHHSDWSPSLREYLRERLPEYMVPSTILALDALPLTPSGKLDRRALPSPEPRRMDLSFVAPVTENGRRIAAVWQEVLGVDRVGRNDDFSDLGGQSLLMVRVHTRLRDVYGNLSLTDLFQYPTVSALAKFLLTHQEGTPTAIRDSGETGSGSIIVRAAARTAGNRSGSERSH